MDPAIREQGVAYWVAFDDTNYPIYHSTPDNSGWYERQMKWRKEFYFLRVNQESGPGWQELDDETPAAVWGEPIHTEKRKKRNRRSNRSRKNPRWKKANKARLVAASAENKPTRPETRSANASKRK